MTAGAKGDASELKAREFRLHADGTYRYARVFVHPSEQSMRERANWLRARGYARGTLFPDGSFVTVVEDDDPSSLNERLGATELHVVLNFFEELKQRVGGS